MSTIFVLNGIMIRMYADEHNPPHFHALYQDDEAVLNINSCKVTEGYLPPKQRKKVEKWAKKYQKELLANWALVENKKQPKSIK